MSKTFKKLVICFIATVLSTIISLILPLISFLNPAALGNLSFKSGIADVSGYDVDGGETVSLSGQWEFFWNKHIVSEKYENPIPDLIVDVPNPWTSYSIKGNKLPNGGIASYRAVLKNVNSFEPILVSIQNLPGACQIFIDGQFVFSNRSVPGSEYDKKDIAEAYANPVKLDPHKKIHEVVIEVDCQYSCGVTTLPVLSTYNDYMNHELMAIAFRYTLIGIVCFYALGLVLLSILNRDLGKQVWLILLCAAFAFRMLISNEGYMVSHRVFGNQNYEIMMPLIFVSTFIIKLCLMMHLIKALDLKARKEALVFFSAVFLIIAFIPYFIYDYVYITTAYLWLQIVTTIFDAYVNFKLAEAIVDKKHFALPYLIFYCVTAVGLIIDNTYLNGFISSKVSFIMPVTSMAFIAYMVVVHMILTVGAFKKAKDNAELKKELNELNTTLMISQIQPHFLYNALNTIKYLTKKDPKTAEKAIVKFSSYLRANMDSISQKEPIDFTKELEHVENYVDLEKLRFGDRLNFETEINSDDFKIPALTIQPIVENAIKHGINQRPEGGTVKIITGEDDDSYFVKIKDNGVGFDVNQKIDDGRSHVGFVNIKKRLEEMMRANVDIKTKINEGTEVTITIPKKERNDAK